MLFIFLSGTFLNSFSQIRPDDISNLKLWLRADSLADTTTTGRRLTQWNDCSLSGNFASQLVTSFQPHYINHETSLNDLPVIHFDGSNFLTFLSQLSLNSFSFFVVFKKDDPNKGILIGSDINNQDCIANFSDGNTYLDIGGPYVSWNTGHILNYSIFSLLSSGNQKELFSNSVSLGIQSIAGTLTSNAIGRRSTSDYLTGNIAEIIIYDQILSTTDRHSVENYLYLKYAPSVNLGPDINVPYGFCATTLDAGSRFTSFLWSTGATTQTIQISNPDTVWVDATDIFGFHSFDTIIVNYPEIALYDTLFCSNSSVVLSTGLAGSYTYNWTGGITTPTLSVNTPGNYAVTITDASLCSAASQIITVSEDDFPSTASLGPDLNLCAGNSIGLIAPITLPTGLTYNWSTLASTPTIAITTSGTYTVTATDLNGCSATDAITATIVGTAPSVHFYATTGCSGAPTQFHNSSNPLGTSWLWDFGDGQTSGLQNPTHTYANGNNYTVRLTVMDGICSNFLDSVIQIHASPISTFAVSTACINNPYTFTDNSTSSEGTITSWDWDFGDASPHSNLQQPSHLYLAADTFNVSLTIQTSIGCQSIFVHPIIVVNSAPAPDQFTLIQPTDNFVTNNPDITFAWNFSNGAVKYKLLYSPDPLFINPIYSLSNLITTQSQHDISVPQKYFWKVVAYGICGDSSVSNIYTFTLFDANSITGMQLWLMGDSIDSLNNLVTLWKDQSGNSNDVVQSNPSFQPSYINSVYSIYNKPALRFNGSSSFLSNTNPTGLMLNSGGSVFIVSKSSDNAGNIISKIDDITPSYGWSAGLGWWSSNYEGNFFVNGAGGFAINPTGTAIATDTFNIYEIIHSTSTGTSAYKNTKLKFNGPYKGINSNSGTLLIAKGIAPNTNNYFSGDIAEIILFNNALSTTDRKTVENYIHNKYAPPVNLGPDIWSSSFCDTVLHASKRFTNYLWNTGATSDSIVVNSGGSYWVSVTDIFGFHSSDTVIVHKPIVTTHSDTICHGDSTTLHSGLTTPYSVLWTHNGDTTLAPDYVIHAGDTIMLHVSDTSGCSLNRQIIMHADNFPIANLLPGSSMNACNGDIIFLDTAAVDTSTITSYDWLAGATHYNTPAFTVPAAWGLGAHTLSLTVTNTRGCVATDNITVNIIGAQPNVNFNFTPVCNDGSSNTAFDPNCSAIGGGTITGFNWNFGDGSSTNTNDSLPFFHSYDSAAYYNVTLTVLTNQGCHKTITQVVPEYSLPEPAFQPHLGCQGALFHFTNMSNNLIGDITGWSWTIDDPNNPQVSNIANPIHVFDSLGYFVIHLTDTTEYGCTKSITDSVRIRYAPHVGFTYTNVCDGNPVYFTDTTQTQVWAPVNTWLWNFGNNQTSTTDNPVYAFDNAGTYNVSLTVHSINGCTATDTEQVVVHAIPSAALALPDYCAQTLYTLHDSSSILAPDSITSWLWDFGTLGTSGDSTPVLTFSNPGVFPVILTVKSNAGCQDMVKDSIHVYPVPTAAFLPSVYYCTAPCTILFTSSSTGSLNYQWTFGDTASLGSIEQDPLHMYSYNDSTGFDVVLINTNNYGCSDTAHQLVFVTPTTGDIKVSNVKAVKLNGFVTLSAHITNLGTRSVYSIDVYAKTAGGTAYKETMDLLTNPLKPGEDTLYTFTGQYQLSDQQVTEYICVEAQITNYVPDDDPTNNEQCLTFTTQFIAFEPYPSPVNDHVNIDFILPFEDNVVIELYGMKGDKVKDIYSGVAQKGLNQFTVDVSDLALAVYTYRIIYRNDQKILKFVKY